MSSRLAFPPCPNHSCTRHQHPHWEQHGLENYAVKVTRYRCGYCGRCARRIYHPVKGGQYFIVELSHGHIAFEVELVQAMIALVETGNNIETPRPSEFSNDLCIYRLCEGDWQKTRHKPR